MKFLRHSYLPFLIFFNLLGTYSSQDDIAESYNNETSSVTPFMGQRRDLVKNQLIREVYADVKSMLRFFPDVSGNLTEAGRSIADVKHFVFGCMSEIKVMRTDLEAIRIQAQQLASVIPKNLTILGREMERRSKVIMQAVKNGSRYTNIGLNKLVKNYKSLKDDYKTIRSHLNQLINNQSGTSSKHEVQTSVAWPMIEQQINTSIAKLHDLLSNHEEIKTSIAQLHDLLSNQEKLNMSITKLRQLLSNQEKMKNSIAKLHNVLSKQEPMDTSMAKFRDVLVNQQQIKAQIGQSRLETNKEIARLDHKIDMAYTGLKEDSKLVHERVISDIIKVMAQISELKDIMSSFTRPATAVPSSPAAHSPGKKIRLSFPKITLPRLAQFSPIQLFKYWPLIEKGVDVIKRITENDPIVGVGGAIGVGKFVEAPKEIKDLTAVFGGVSGLTMIRDAELVLLQELLSELPPLIGIPLPIPTPAGLPIGHPIGYPIGDPIDNPIGYPLNNPIGYPISNPIGYPISNPIGYPIGAPTDNPIGYPIATPIGTPIVSPIGNPRPADPSTTPPPFSWYDTLSDLGLNDLIDTFGDIWSDNLGREPMVLPTDLPELPELADMPPDTVIQPMIPGIPGLIPDLFITPTLKPTLPSVPEFPDIVPEPIKPPVPDIPDIYPASPGLPKPTSHPPATPTTPHTPEPPTLLEPITIINADGLDNHCLCSCPCDCTCPILPIEFPKGPLKRQWWARFHHFRQHGGNLDCKCMCACPCPLEATAQSSPGVTTQSTPLTTTTEEAIARDSSQSQSPWVLPMDDSHLYYDDPMGNDHWAQPTTGVPKTDDKDENWSSKIGNIATDINDLREDFKILKITVRDEMVITRESIMSQMEAKFMDVGAALAGVHHANILLHSNDKNATDNVKEFVKGQFTRTWSTLRSVGGAINKMNKAVEDMMQTYYNGVMEFPPQQYNPYRQKRQRFQGMRQPPFMRRSASPESA